MHIVVVGCGRVGSGLALELQRLGHTSAIVDRSKRSFRRLGADYEGDMVEGSGFDRETLLEAGIDRADGVAAVTSGDNSNILTARIARENFLIENVVARIYDPRRAEIYQRLGIPTVATVTWTIDHVRRWLLPDEMTAQWSDATGALALIDRVLPPALAGRPLAELEAAVGISVVAVTRAGVPRLDASTLVGQEGDLLHIAVLKEAVPELARLLGDESKGAQ